MFLRVTNELPPNQKGYYTMRTNKLTVTMMFVASMAWASAANAEEPCGAPVETFNSCEVVQAPDCYDLCQPDAMVVACVAENAERCMADCAGPGEIACAPTCEQECGNTCAAALVQEKPQECKVSCGAACMGDCGAGCEASDDKVACFAACNQQCGAHCEASCDGGGALETDGLDYDRGPAALVEEAPQDCKISCGASCMGECASGCEASDDKVACFANCGQQCGAQCAVSCDGKKDGKKDGKQQPQNVIDNGTNNYQENWGHRDDDDDHKGWHKRWRDDDDDHKGWRDDDDDHKRGWHDDDDDHKMETSGLGYDRGPAALVEEAPQECKVSCGATCMGDCAAGCEASDDKVACFANCSQQCGAHCEASCSLIDGGTDTDVVDPQSMRSSVDQITNGCQPTCEQSCTGACEASNARDCELDCQVGAVDVCKPQMSNSCADQCGHGAVLLCDGQYLQVSDVNACVAALEHAGVAIDGPIAALDGELIADALQGASCSVDGSKDFRLGALLTLLGFGLGATLLRRRQA